MRTNKKKPKSTAIRMSLALNTTTQSLLISCLVSLRKEKFKLSQSQFILRSKTVPLYKPIPIKMTFQQPQKSAKSVADCWTTVFLTFCRSITLNSSLSNAKVATMQHITIPPTISWRTGIRMCSVK